MAKLLSEVRVIVLAQLMGRYSIIKAVELCFTFGLACVV